MIAGKWKWKIKPRFLHFAFCLLYRNINLSMTGRVLVLNASFEPINVCNERRAVVMIFKGVARVEEHNGHMLHSEKLVIHAPSVIRLDGIRADSVRAALAVAQEHSAARPFDLPVLRQAVCAV